MMTRNCRVIQTTKLVLRYSANSSSSEWVVSGTTPKMAMRTAPPAMRKVPRIRYFEKRSPSSTRAKNAFQRSET